VKFQFPSKIWKIEILFLIEESSKTFAYFLYKPSSPLSPSDDPLLQETPFEIVEYHSNVGVGGHVELHPSVRRADAAIHQAMEVLVDTKGLSHTLRCWLNVVVECGGVCRCIPIPLRLLMLHHYYSFIWKRINYIFSSLCIHFLLLSQF